MHDFPPLPIVITNQSLKERWNKWKHFSQRRKETFIENHIMTMHSKHFKYLRYT
jgi:urocanate hydratase